MPRVADPPHARWFASANPSLVPAVPTGPSQATVFAGRLTRPTTNDTKKALLIDNGKSFLRGPSSTGDQTGPGIPKGPPGAPFPKVPRGLSGDGWRPAKMPSAARGREQKRAPAPPPPKERESTAKPTQSP